MRLPYPTLSPSYTDQVHPGCLGGSLLQLFAYPDLPCCLCTIPHVSVAFLGRGMVSAFLLRLPYECIFCLQEQSAGGLAGCGTYSFVSPTACKMQDIRTNSNATGSWEGS